MTSDPRWLTNQRCYRATRDQSDGFIPALLDIIKSGDWREFEHPNRGMLRYDRFSDYCGEFLGIPAPAVLGVLQGTSSTYAAEQIRRMLAEDVPEAAPHGGAREQVSDTHSTQARRDATAILARLKRDRPDLAAQVVDGTLSANEAAIAAGIRKRYIRVRADDPQVAIAKLEEHFGIKLKIV